ncbi:hypothetical protein D3C86_1289220 [compost metagenome]
MFAHQLGVGGFDKDFEFNGALILGQQVAFDLPDPDLLVEHRAAAVQRAETISLDGQVQTGLRVGQRRFFGQRLELAGRFAFTRADRDVVTRHQGFQAGDTRQGHAWLDQPEARAGPEVLLDVLVHLDGGDDALGGAFVVELEGFYLTHGHAFVDDLGLVGLDAFTTFETHQNLDAGLVVGTPAKPAADDQGDQGQHPDSGPVRGRSGFCCRQISHGRHPTPCYPKSVGDRK